MSAPPTIFALSTAPGRAAIAVFRVSGTRSRTVLAEIAGIAAPAPRRAARARLRDPATGETLDDGIAIWFPGPASYTGEDMAELQVHGGRAVVEAVGLALGRIDGLSPAEPGAFTRRAFFAGKLDLTRIEALADLIAAETEAQRRQAQRQAGGALARLYDGWRERLLRCLAHVEAAIDFPDEDLPDGIDETVRAELGALRAALDAHLADGGRGERLRAGVQVAILGPPNAGKSTLFNRLAGREAAIVSAEAGTTRDVLEVHLDLGGYPALLADTAGLRRTGGAVEAEGVARARARAETADLRLVLLDACAWPEIPRGLAALVDDDAVVAANKVDLAALPEGAALRGRPVLAVSALTGAGLDELVHALTAGVAAKAALGAEPAPTRLRHRLALEACRGSLARAVSDAEIALRAEDLRAALAALGRITGRVDVEDVLDAVFAEFCIGK